MCHGKRSSKSARPTSTPERLTPQRKSRTASGFSVSVSVRGRRGPRSPALLLVSVGVAGGLLDRNGRDATSNVKDMNLSFAFEQAFLCTAGVWLKRLTQQTRKWFRHRPQGNCLKIFAVVGDQGATIRATKAVGFLRGRVKHRSKVAGRRVDDLQYFRRSSLLF
jgi:hypothetical protein